MKLANPVLILILALVFLGVLALQVVSGSPRTEALTFVDALQSGNLPRAVGHFDANTCRCSAKGGWGSYLVYQSGQEPNVAFLVGRKFQVGEPKITALDKKGNSGALWLQAERAIVDLTLEFDPKQYSPMLLPVPLAYGMNMTLAEFKKFIDDPGNGMGRGLSLRLRRGLKPGDIKPDLDNLDEKTKARFSFTRFSTSDYQRGPGTIDTDTAERYLRMASLAHPGKSIVPMDAARVLDSKNNPVPIETLEKQLPRLKSIVLSLALNHNGPLNNWMIARLALLDPVFTEENGTKEVDLARNKNRRQRYEP
ncbi:MAG: hypothetical protein C5B53_03855 [Candidatus Melainabacteria bacterium]|nr:MAG: hypothetical protein C5B53_03855 [Candidatus Melainabacteria bacterium]